MSKLSNLTGVVGIKTQRKFAVVIERDEDGFYVASVPSLRGCHTQAKNLDTLTKRICEEIRSIDSAEPLLGVALLELASNNVYF